jgi:glycosyltransferase involved in cell wall biosynthesis
LDIEVRSQGAVKIIKLRGRLSLGEGCDRLRATFEDLLRAGDNRLILDLKERLEKGEKLDLAVEQAQLRTLLKSESEARRWPDYGGDSPIGATTIGGWVPGLRLVGFGLKPPRRPADWDEFHVNPPQGALAALYSGCDIYLCPSWDEGLGMPPMEAMACGAALVTYDNGGCRDYARDGETALVAKRRDLDELAAKLERLAADPALRGRIAAAGAALVTTAFDWDRAVERLERLFRQTRADVRPA